jgi:hypothetical protein
MEGEEGSKFFQQLLDIWVKPEIERRRQGGKLPDTFVLESAQVIMNVGSPTVVRLNGEVKAFMKVVPKGFPGQPGATVYWDEIERVEDFQLTEDDPNAGHATMLRAGDGRWRLFFDFRYNAQRVGELLRAAEEFLAASEYARSCGHPRALMENLFAAAELMAKAELAMQPDERILEARKHKFIGSRINMWARLGNINQEFVDVLNQLLQERGTARYVEGEIEISDEMDKMVLVVKRQLAVMKRDTQGRFQPDLK